MRGLAIAIIIATSIFLGGCQDAYDGRRSVVDAGTSAPSAAALADQIHGNALASVLIGGFVGAAIFGRSFALESVAGAAAVPSRQNLQVQVIDDPFEQFVHFVGPAQTNVIFSPPRAQTDTSVTLNSLLNKRSGAVSHQIQMRDVYRGEWRYWFRAMDQSAQPLEFRPITRTVETCSNAASIGCRFIEVFGVDVSDAALRAARAGEICFKAYARDNGDVVHCTQASIIAMQLEAIDSRRPAVVIGQGSAQQTGYGRRRIE